MDAITHEQWIGVCILSVAMANVAALVVARFVCQLVRIFQIQGDDQEKMFDPMSPRGLTNDTFDPSTSALDDAEELAECETVISDTVVRV